MAVCYLALGSNIGDRRKYLDTALNELRRAGLQIEQISTVIESAPVGGPHQGNFLNAVLKATTTHSPQELLHLTQTIEQNSGRTRTVKDGPRTLDIDILIYDNLKLNSRDLTIPHPRMLQRNFVMVPLKEIAPDLVKDLIHAYHS